MGDDATQNMGFSPVSTTTTRCATAREDNAEFEVPIILGFASIAHESRASAPGFVEQPLGLREFMQPQWERKQVRQGNDGRTAVHTRTVEAYFKAKRNADGVTDG